jgi:LAS superfamily LD-carboxypeptidase LdcB
MKTLWRRSWCFVWLSAVPLTAVPVFADATSEKSPPTAAPTNEAVALLQPERLSRAGLSDEAYAFKQQVYRLHVERGGKLGRTRVFDLPPSELAPIPGTSIQMQKDAAVALGKLLAAARLDLANDLAAPVGDAATEQRRARAKRVQELSVNNAYRSASLQFSIWDRNFARYYQDTASKRRELPGGEHGAAAAELLREYIGIRVAAPGFSNHQNGIAVDFALRLKANGATAEQNLSASMAQSDPWKESWFWHWLVGRAGEFGFVPYEPEPWHWEYKPETVARNRKNK